MAFLSALPSGGVCGVFTDAQLAKTSEATSNTIVVWSFMAFVNAKFRGRSQSFGSARTDRDLTVANHEEQRRPSRCRHSKEKIGWDSVYASKRSDRSYFPIESVAGSLPESLAAGH
jgi:hypothetical protein